MCARFSESLGFSLDKFIIIMYNWNNRYVAQWQSGRMSDDCYNILGYTVLIYGGNTGGGDPEAKVRVLPYVSKIIAFSYIEALNKTSAF